MDDARLAIVIGLAVFVSIVLMIRGKRRTLDRLKARSCIVSLVASDGHEYMVRKGPTSHEAAEILSEVRVMTEAILSSVEAGCREVCGDASILLDRIRQQEIQFGELRPAGDDPVAININKGELIQLCLFGPRGHDGHRVSMDALFTVVVHELAHMMEWETSPMIDGHSVHSDRFKVNEGFLMEHASRLGFVPPGGAVGESFCGITIPSSNESM